MSAPYAKRAISVTFQLGKGSFGASGSNTITHSGLRVFLTTEWANLPSQPTAIIRIYGLTLSEMNALTVAGLNWLNRDNLVRVDAGDVGDQLTTVYSGTIKEAFPDFREAPDSAFMVTAIGGATTNVKPPQPVTFAGATPFATAMQQILKPTGLTHENNGVNAILQSPYFPGSSMAQINRALQHANCFGVLDPMANKLATWPKTGSRGGDATVISAATGMIGYPEFEKVFIRVRTRFDGSLYKGVGKKIKVETQLTAAQGIWNIIQVDLNLASEMPGGPWEIIMKAGHDPAGGVAA